MEFEIKTRFYFFLERDLMEIVAPVKKCRILSITQLTKSNHITIVSNFITINTLLYFLFYRFCILLNNLSLHPNT